MIRDFFDKVLDFIYPTKCMICNEAIIKRGEYLCSDCKKAFKINSTLVYLDLSTEKYIKCLCMSEYCGNMKDAICRFKFLGHKDYSMFFAGFMAREIKKKFSDVSFDFITFVPLRAERKRKRGYNQSECIASDISKIIGVPCESLITKIKSNHIQHELDFASRAENVNGVYAAENGNLIKGKTILLCDDVVTSGSTLKECAKVLYESGAKDVYSCAVASAFKPYCLNKHI